jgi:uncharacterized protein YfaQ (DUF2300 family)
VDDAAVAAARQKERPSNTAWHEMWHEGAATGWLRSLTRATPRLLLQVKALIDAEWPLYKR